MNLDIKDLVKGNCKFAFYRRGSLYYETESKFLFEVPVEDCGDTTFASEERAMLFMKWIKRAVKLHQEQNQES